jgi:hypothetical protein
MATCVGVIFYARVRVFRDRKNIIVPIAFILDSALVILTCFYLLPFQNFRHKNLKSNRYMPTMLKDRYIFAYLYFLC